MNVLYVVVLFVIVGIMLSVMLNVLGGEDIVDCEDYVQGVAGGFVSGKMFEQLNANSPNAVPLNFIQFRDSVQVYADLNTEKGYRFNGNGINIISNNVTDFFPFEVEFVNDSSRISIRVQEFDIDEDGNQASGATTIVDYRSSVVNPMFVNYADNLVSGKALRYLAGDAADSFTIFQYYDTVLIRADRAAGGTGVWFESRHGVMGNFTTFFEIDLNDHVANEDTSAVTIYNDSLDMVVAYSVVQERDPYCVGCVTADVWRSSCDMVQGNGITGSSMLVLILLVIAAVAIIGTLRIMG